MLTDATVAFVCPVYCVLCTVYCVLCTVYRGLWTVYCVLCTVYAPHHHSFPNRCCCPNRALRELGIGMPCPKTVAATTCADHPNERELFLRFLTDIGFGDTPDVHYPLAGDASTLHAFVIVSRSYLLLSDASTLCASVCRVLLRWATTLCHAVI